MSLKLAIIIAGVFLFLVICVFIGAIWGIPKLQEWLRKKYSPSKTRGLARIEEGGVEVEVESELIRDTPLCSTYQRRMLIEGEKVWVEDYVPKTHNVEEDGKKRTIEGVPETYFMGRRVYYVDSGNAIAYGIRKKGLLPDPARIESIEKTTVAYYVAYYAPTGTKSEFPSESLSQEKFESTGVKVAESVDTDPGGLPWKWIIIIIAIIALVGIVAMATGTFKKPAPIIINTYNATANYTGNQTVITGTVVK